MPHFIFDNTTLKSNLKQKINHLRGPHSGYQLYVGSDRAPRPSSRTSLRRTPNLLGTYITSWTSLHNTHMCNPQSYIHKINLLDLTLDLSTGRPLPFPQVSPPLQIVAATLSVVWKSCVPFHYRQSHCDHPLHGECFDGPTLAAFSSSQIQPLISSGNMLTSTLGSYLGLGNSR